MGTGFVVKNKDPAKGWFLITDLHVVYRCSRLVIKKLACSLEEDAALGVSPRTLELAKGSVVRVWPELDLAAIPLTTPIPAAKAEFDSAPQLKSASLAALKTGLQLLFWGKTDFGPCAEGPASVMYGSDVGHLAQTVAAQTHHGEDEVRGSLRKDLKLLYYFGPVGPGASGGPVVVATGEGVLIGIHQGGVLDYPVGWAIGMANFDVEKTPRPDDPKLGDDAWPQYSPPALAQSEKETVPEIVHLLGYRAKTRLIGVSLSVDALFGVTDGTGPMLGTRIHLTAYHELVAGPGDNPYASLGITAGVAWTAGRYQQTYRGLDGTRLSTKVVDSELGGNFLAETGLEVRFNRLDRFRPSVGLGIRAGAIKVPAPVGSYANAFFAVPVFARMSFWVGESHAILLQAGAAWELGPPLNFQYTGAAAALEPEDQRLWGVTLSGGLGYEFAF